MWSMYLCKKWFLRTLVSSSMKYVVWNWRAEHIGRFSSDIVTPDNKIMWHTIGKCSSKWSLHILTRIFLFTWFRSIFLQAASELFRRYTHSVFYFPNKFISNAPRIEHFSTNNLNKSHRASIFKLFISRFIDFKPFSRLRSRLHSRPCVIWTSIAIAKATRQVKACSSYKLTDLLIRYLFP